MKVWTSQPANQENRWPRSKLGRVIGLAIFAVLLSLVGVKAYVWACDSWQGPKQSQWVWDWSDWVRYSKNDGYHYMYTVTDKVVGPYDKPKDHPLQQYPKDYDQIDAHFHEVWEKYQIDHYWETDYYNADIYFWYWGYERQGHYHYYHYNYYTYDTHPCDEWGTDKYGNPVCTHRYTCYCCGTGQNGPYSDGDSLPEMRYQSQPEPYCVEAWRGNNGQANWWYRLCQHKEVPWVNPVLNGPYRVEGPYDRMLSQQKSPLPYNMVNYRYDRLVQANVYWKTEYYDKEIGPTTWALDYEYHTWGHYQRDWYHDWHHVEDWRVKYVPKTGAMCGAGVPGLPACYFGPPPTKLDTIDPYWENQRYTDKLLNKYQKVNEGPHVTQQHVYYTAWQTIQTNVPYDAKWRVLAGVDRQAWLDVFKYDIHQMEHDQQQRYQQIWQVYYYTKTGYLCGAPDLPVCHYEHGSVISQTPQYQWINPHDAVVGHYQDQIGVQNSDPAVPVQAGRGGVYAITLFSIAERNNPSQTGDLHVKSDPASPLDPDQTLVSGIQVKTPWGAPKVQQVGANGWKFAVTVPASPEVAPDGTYNVDVTVTGVDPQGGSWSKNFTIPVQVNGDASNPIGSQLTK